MPPRGIAAAPSSAESSGNYKLTSVLGHGGTGTVYLGERADRQYSAQVAVKIIDAATVQGDLGTALSGRAPDPRQPESPEHRATLDAGETEEAQPYLIMEYVHGEPVDRYCDRQQLDIRARLDIVSGSLRRGRSTRTRT